MSPALRTLTLLVPGLLDAPVSARAPSAPALARLLARAECEADPRRDPDHALFAAFGIALDSGAAAPVAPVTRLFDTGEADDACWLRADPVHLAPGRDRLLLAEPAAVELTRREAVALAGCIVDALPELANRLEAPAAGRWYLRAAECPDMRTWPPHAVSGRDAGAFLPSGPAAGPWCALMNDMQMALHAAALNEERESRGLLPVNSVWLWGAGRLPRAERVPWIQVWADDALSGGLARLSEVPALPVPSSAEVWLRQADRAGEHLLVLDGAATALRSGGSDAWSALVDAFERDWADPLAAAIRDGTLQQLHLQPLNGREYVVDKRTLRRFWRTARGLAAHLAASDHMSTLP